MCIQEDMVYCNRMSSDYLYFWGALATSPFQVQD